MNVYGILLCGVFILVIYFPLKLSIFCLLSVHRITSTNTAQKNDSFPMNDLGCYTYIHIPPHNHANIITFVPKAYDDDE